MSSLGSWCSALVIDDSPTARTAIRAMLGIIQIVKVDFASSAMDAKIKMKNAQRNYDIILCDYNLGDKKQNGQELLEELKRNRLLDPATLFIMITAESTYEMVVAAAEVGPDDYLLKPFKANDLLARLEKTHVKKQAFSSVFDAIRSQKMSEAISECQRLFDDSKYGSEAMKICAELFIQMENYTEGMKLYDKIIADKMVPWARLGKAKIFAKTNQVKESNELLASLIQEHPLVVDAYDLLYANLTAEGKTEEAYEVMMKAIKVNGRNVERLQKAGELAVILNKPEEADQFFKKSLELGKNSVHYTAESLINLFLLHLNNPIEPKALKTLVGDLQRVTQNHPLSEFYRLLAKACLGSDMSANIKQDQAAHPIKEASKFLTHPRLNFHAARQFVQVALKVKDVAELLPEWLTLVSLRYVQTKVELNTFRSLFLDNTDQFEPMELAYNQVSEVNNSSINLTMKKQADEAIELLYTFAMKTYNSRTGFNACNLMIKVDRKKYADRIHQLLEWLIYANAEKVKSIVAQLNAED